MAELTQAQKKFIKALQGGKTPSRNLNDRTGKSLAKLGLVIFIVMVGWVATPKGFAADVSGED